MEELKSSFEPRFEIILANIGLIRKSIKTYCENSISEFHSLMKDNFIKIVESVPEFNNMVSDLNETELQFWKENWKNGDKEPVCFIFGWMEVKDFKLDPYIGICVTSDWVKYKEFNKILEQESKAKDFRFLIEYSTEWEKDSIARFKHIEIAKYGKGEIFDSKNFLNDIIEEFKNLVKLIDVIDKYFEGYNKVKSKK